MAPRLAILLSGAGSTYANLAEAVVGGRLRAEIACVVSSRPEAGGLRIAAERGHRAVVATRAEGIAQALAESGAEWVAMCGWMRFWDPPAPWAGKVVNIHPSLLPSFGGKGMYGINVHRAVLAAGCKVSGCTVHLVAGAYDSGPILAQRTVAVLPEDAPEDLQQRVQAAERELYPQALACLLSGGLRARDGRYWIEGLDRCTVPAKD